MIVAIPKLLSLFPLFLVVTFLALRVAKEFKPKTTANRAELKVLFRAAAYALVAGILGMAYIPNLMGSWGGFFGCVFASILALAIYLCVVDFAGRPRLSKLDPYLWRESIKTPIYSRTKKTVPYVRWGRRAAMVAYVLFVFVVALAGGTSDNKVQASDVDGSFTAATTVQPSQSESPASASTPRVDPDAFENPCKDKDNGGPATIADIDDKNVPFGVGSLKVCHNNDWRSWAEAYPGVDAPKEVLVKASSKDGSYMYAVIMFNSTQSVVRTSDF